MWRKQIEIPVRWIVAFIAGHKGDLTRTLTLDSYLRYGKSVVPPTRASPYGMRAILLVNGTLIAHFSDHICQSDRDILGLHAEPTSRDQQALEALAVLASLREYSQFWKSERITLCIRTDNIASLCMLAKMQPHSPQLGIVARELALDISDATYSPDIVEHIPGIVNIGADALSRMSDPNKEVTLPSYLTDATRHVCSRRDKSWWRSVEVPA